MSRDGQEERLALIVFAKPTDKLTEEHILPNISYWNYRSGDVLTIFFVGYDADINASTSEFSTNIMSEDLKSGFSVKDFGKAVNRFEKETTWEYPGEPSIIFQCSPRAE